jgi:hypothetical protein
MAIHTLLKHLVASSIVTSVKHEVCKLGFNSSSLGKSMKLQTWCAEKIAIVRRHRLIALASITLISLAPIALEATMKVKSDVQWQEEKDFVFAGHCFNGAQYWMLASEEVVDGKITPFVSYRGPAGSGTVYTDTSPKVMVERICRANADIVSHL